jgi:hypothetical protein
MPFWKNVRPITALFPGITDSTIMTAAPTPVGLNYLTLSGKRFVAIWRSRLALETDEPPLRYCLQGAEQPLPEWSTVACWLALPRPELARIYRNIRRRELPPDLQKQIQFEIERARTRPMPTHLIQSPLGTATPDTLKQHYRQWAKSLHPDQGGNSDSFMALQSAYRYLCRYWRL